MISGHREQVLEMDPYFYIYIICINIFGTHFRALEVHIMEDVRARVGGGGGKALR